MTKTQAKNQARQREIGIVYEVLNNYNVAIPMVVAREIIEALETGELSPSHEQAKA